MRALLFWLGTRAQWVLFVGVCLALFLPQLSKFLAPFLPALVSLVLGLAIARLDLTALAKRFLSLRYVLWQIGLVLLIMPLTGVVLVGAFRLLGASDSVLIMVLVFAAAPPIASATNLCLILGYDAEKALDLTLVATVLTPLIGPAMFVFYLGQDLDLSAAVLASRLIKIIAGGFVIGIAIQVLWGRARIGRNKLIFDGIAALVMVVFVLPVFAGISAAVLAAPLRAFGVLVLASGLNLGSNVLISRLARWRAKPAAAGTYGLTMGNRTVAIYLAVLPFDPMLGLFVALYQFPMCFTPVLFSWRKRGPVKDDPTAQPWT